MSKEWRKSWCSLNIHGHNGSGISSKRKLEPDERSVWDDYLDMARLSPVSGQVCISKTLGYSRDQLAHILKITVDLLNRANTRMKELGMITIENNGIVVVNNWKMYQPDYERLKVYKGGKYTFEDTEEDTTEGTPRNTNTKEKKRKENIYIRVQYKPIYKEIMDHWNTKKIIIHKLLTDSCYGVINTKLDAGHTKEEILQAISNYSFILNSNRHFWTYKWTLHEFLRRGFDKFMDLGVAKQNYRNRHESDVQGDVEDILGGNK